MSTVGRRQGPSLHRGAGARGHVWVITRGAASACGRRRSKAHCARGPVERATRSAPRSGHRGAHLFLALPADLTAAADVRTRLAAWLTDARLARPQAQEDLVLAVNEAVSNSVEHGYGLRPGVPGRPGWSRSPPSRLARPLRGDHRARPRGLAHRRRGCATTAATASRS